MTYSSILQLVTHAAHEQNDACAFSLKVGFRTKSYSYREIHEYVIRFPAFFKKHGIKKGDRILILSLNRPEYAALILGCLVTGVILVAVDYRTNKETVKKFMYEVKPKAVFTTALYKHLFFFNKKILFEELFVDLEKCEKAVPESQPDSMALAAIMFTSGTTGDPKGTMITNGNIIASINSMREVLLLKKQLRILSILPLSHALEMFGGLLVAYSYGCHIHYLERVNSITILQSLKRYRIQAMAVVPQMLRLILQTVERKVKENKKEWQWHIAHALAAYFTFPFRRFFFRDLHKTMGGSFLFFATGSAPLELKVAQLWENMGIQIVEGYGASETTGFIATNSPKHNAIGTVGKILPHMSHTISETGELLVKGGNVVGGYFHNEEETNEAFKNGWFHTGDIVSFDRWKNMKIIGRDKFKIVLADGKKVYPEDIEKKLNNNKYVQDSTVFGINTQDGEIVHAEIITGYPHQLGRIIDDVNKQVNPHEQIIDFARWTLGDFPRTKTLKVDREAVRQAVLARKQNHTVENGNTGDEEKDAIARILAEVSGKARVSLRGNMKLSTDLKLDSLKRIELLALIEEEMGVSVNELKITPQTTIADLRDLIKHGKPVVIEDPIQIPSWQFTPFMDSLRIFLQKAIVFPSLNVPIKLSVKYPENIALIKTPQLFIFNHVGVYDVVNDLRVLPPQIRKKTAIAATELFWTKDTYRGVFASVFGNCFPFVRAEEHEAMKQNFERVGEILDRGYNIFISPEANITKTGELLPFHTGAGYIAVEMGVPVTVFKLVGLFELWPEDPDSKWNLFKPKKSGKVEVIISKPITFSKKISYEKATRILREEMVRLH